MSSNTYRGGTMPITVYLTKEQVLAIEDELKRELKRVAIEKKVATSEAQLAVRDILPKTDLGFENEVWATGTLPAFTYTTVSSFRVPDNKVIGFYGVKDLAGGIGTGITSVIRFTLGPGKSKVIDLWQIQKIESEEEVEGYSDKMIIYGPGEYLGIDFYNVETGVSNVKLLGFVVEPKGELVGQG
jgi:hypothetical protein